MFTQVGTYFKGLCYQPYLQLNVHTFEISHRDFMVHNDILYYDEN